MQNIINMYSEEKLDQLLKDPNELNNLYKSSIDSKNNIVSTSEPTLKSKGADSKNIIASTSEAKFITKAIEKYIKKLVLSKNMLNDERL